MTSVDASLSGEWVAGIARTGTTDLAAVPVRATIDVEVVFGVDWSDAATGPATAALLLLLLLLLPKAAIATQAAKRAAKEAVRVSEALRSCCIMVVLPKLRLTAPVVVRKICCRYFRQMGLCIQ
ncbi:hypothetical protein PEC18_20615 [Paucibacter sp. O1-1]|nr:hypothetical protein [Paucibacter sp. O1-1]MDA3828156.1 hypothetical protein [Paucibacter sp. O1-1]